MKIIITGASGFVGVHLSEYLISLNYGVKKLSLRGNNSVDNLDKSAQAIIHLAGKAHDTKNTTEASEYFKINSDLTSELFDIFLSSTISDFIYFSSVKAVADVVDGTLTEDIVPNPKSPYGLSKLKAEEYILSKKLPEGKRVFIIRPCMIYGPGNKGNLNLLYNIVKKGIPYPLAAFENERSFLSIYNLTYIVEKIISDKTISSGVYNVADDEVLSTNDLVKIIAKASHKKPRLIKVPKKAIEGLAKMGDILKLSFNSETLKKLTENYRVSNKKIKEALKINNMPKNATSGLEKTIKSFIK